MFVRLGRYRRSSASKHVDCTIFSVCGLVGPHTGFCPLLNCLGLVISGSAEPSFLSSFTRPVAGFLTAGLFYQLAW